MDKFGFLQNDKGGVEYAMKTKSTIEHKGV